MRSTVCGPGLTASYGVSEHYHGIVSSAYYGVDIRPRDGMADAPGSPMRYKVRSCPLSVGVAGSLKGDMGVPAWAMGPFASFRMREMPHPPPTPRLSRAAIVRYLDYVDRRIRRYVSAKRKLIALLKEERQAIVN